MTDAARAIQEQAASSPADIRASGWVEVLKRSWAESSKDNVNIIAAGVAFYAFLAFVPLLAAMMLTYGLVAEPSSVVRHMQALTGMMPADAAQLIGQQLMSMSQTAQGQKGFGLILALLLAIYGAMRGSSSIITALNVVYNVEEDRGFIRSTLLALALTLGALVALLVAILAVSSLGYIEALLPSAAPWLHALLRILFWVAAAAVISTLVAMIYRYAPNRPNPKWRWLTPGSLAATFLWVVATLGFGFYVANFGNYNATYGSLGAVIVFLTWLYLTAYILLMGGELNAELEKQTSCNTLAP
ncbi:MAG TPA: YihY/virulence factor BrkB family protein [Allosphingosinicella sp.]|jgi:membrane protein